MRSYSLLLALSPPLDARGGVSVNRKGLVRPPFATRRAWALVAAGVLVQIAVKGLERSP